MLTCLFCGAAAAQDRVAGVPPPTLIERPAIRPAGPTPPSTGARTAGFPEGAPDSLVFLRTAAQLPPRGKTAEGDIDFVVTTELPGPDRLFARDSEKQFFDRVRQDARKKPGSPPIFFPEYIPLTREPYAGRNWPTSVAVVEPAYVCHGRLLFEQPNFERYGWDVGVLTPVVNAAAYYYDLAMLPYHYWTRPWECWDCSAGRCLPGDPVPLLWYREKFSWTGLAAQAAVITGGFYIVP